MRKKILALAILIAVGGGAWYFTSKAKMESSVAMPNVDEGEVVAIVDGKKIKAAEVREFAATIPQLKELPFEMVYPQLLDTMINARVLLLAAEKEGLESDPEVKKNMQLAKDQILSQTYLLKKLESSMTAEKLKALYEEEMKNYTPQEEVRAKHILLNSKKEAQDVLVQLRAGADFATLANTKSLDSENKDGELGYFTKSMMIPEFGEAVFALRKGEISEPIKTPFGWHVVLVEDKRLAAPPAMEDIKDQLKQTYMDKNAKSVLLEERQKFNVQVLKPTLNENQAAPQPADTKEEATEQVADTAEAE